MRGTPTIAQVRIDAVQSASDVMVAVDGALINENTPYTPSAFAQFESWSIYGGSAAGQPQHFFLTSYLKQTGNGDRVNDSIYGGLNEPYNANGDIHWRHGNSEPGGPGNANAVHLDGHASTYQYNAPGDTTMLLRNILLTF